MDSESLRGLVQEADGRPGLIETLDPSEQARLLAADGVMFSRKMFPAAFRQRSPKMHRDVWDALEDPTHRKIALKMFRDSAKTTILRAFTAKRIGYGISRTVLYVSASQAHSVKSLSWLQKQVVGNRLFAATYGLTPGKKWTEEWIEINHNSLGLTINVLAVGITGQVRGINIDDWRPDLIVCDDIDTEETTSTPDQIKKTSDLLFGAILNSLAPASENPAAKIVLLQTPFSSGDIISVCEKAEDWAFREFGVFNSDGESNWPDRWTTEELRQEKLNYINKGQLLLWMREKEVKVIADVLADFHTDDLQFWHLIEQDAPIPTFMWIDPVPPPPPGRNLTPSPKRDHEAIVVVGYYRGSFYCLECSSSQGHTPDWTISEFFRLCTKWRPLRIGVETTAYQRTLAWLLSKEMQTRKRFYAIEEIDDKRGKRLRIVQSLAGPAKEKRLFIHPTHTKILEQFAAYPNVQHEDELEAFAGAVWLATQYAAGAQDDEETGNALPYESKERRIVENWSRSAP